MNLSLVPACGEVVRLALHDATELATAALLRAGVEAQSARITAEALVAADADGLPSHGLARLPYYLAQVRRGKIVGGAVAQVAIKGATVQVDARYGFSFPAVRAGLSAAIGLVRELGVVAVSIGHSHHFGVAGHPVEHAARHGALAIAFSNAPAAIAPWGGNRPLFGTNPIAFASPRREGNPLVIDLSLSKAARGKIMLAQQQGLSIPDDWALDVNGAPTTDATAALAGSMVPAGGVKGAALALMVELMCAGLGGSNFGYEASSFFDDRGNPPGVAQLLLLIDPSRFSSAYVDSAERLLAEVMKQPGVRLPGERRWAARSKHSAEGIFLPLELVRKLRDEDPQP